MTVTITTVYQTGASLSATLERVSDGYLWNNTAQAWQAAPALSAQKFTLTEASGYYAGSNTGDMGDAGTVRVRVYDDNLATVVGAEEFYVYGGVEVREDPYSVDTVLTAAHGSGSWQSAKGSAVGTTVVLTLSDANGAVESASVWVATDAAGTVLVAGPLLTDASGQVETFLQDATAYYLWATATAHNPIIAEGFTSSASLGNAFTIALTDGASAPTYDLGAGNTPVSVYDLLPLVSPYLEGCPENVQKQALREAARYFCKDSEVWIVEQEHDLTEDTYTITLTASDWDAMVGGVDKVVDADDHEYDLGRALTVSRSGVLTFKNELDDSEIITVTFTLHPRLTCEEYPEWLLERWDHAVASKALSDLMSLKGKPWFSPESAQYYESRYQMLVAEAKSTRLKDYSNKQREYLPRFV